jgi:hypothetical protein
MRKYFPIIISLMIIVAAGYFVVNKKNKNNVGKTKNKVFVNIMGTFNVQRRCAKSPEFLKQLKIPQPVMIDLSQKRFKGIALLYGKQFQEVLQPKTWERYGHFGTYTVDKKGNIYLVPMPFISILPTTFNLQKNIYKLDSKTGKLSIFMHLDDVIPNANNPYGIGSIVYDCDDDSLWVSAIDESDYQTQKGVIYHIDPHHKKILQKVKGFDALSIQLIKSSRGKYLLAGSARDSALYAFPIVDGTMKKVPEKVLTLSNANEHIRKIKVKGKNRLELQSIPFSYALIAQTRHNDRTHYSAVWNEKHHQWEIKKYETL